MILHTHVWDTGFRRTYRFKAMWITHLGCEEVIKLAWDNEVPSSLSFCLMQKLKPTRNALIVWNKNTFGNLNRRKRKLEQYLMVAQRNLDSSNYKFEK